MLTGVILSNHQLDTIFDCIPLINVIDFKKILDDFKSTTKFSENKIVVVKLRQNVNGYQRLSLPEGCSIVKKCHVIENNDVEPQLVGTSRQSTIANQSRYFTTVTQSEIFTKSSLRVQGKSLAIKQDRLKTSFNIVARWKGDLS